LHIFQRSISTQNFNILPQYTNSGASNTLPLQADMAAMFVLLMVASRGMAIIPRIPKIHKFVWKLLGGETHTNTMTS